MKYSRITFFKDFINFFKFFNNNIGNFTRSDVKPTDLEDYAEWLVREKSKLDRFRQLKSEIELMKRIAYNDHIIEHNQLNHKNNNLSGLSAKLDMIIEQLEREDMRRITEEL